MDLRLARVTPDNVAAACRLRIRPEQEGVVAPVAESLAEVWEEARRRGQDRITVLWERHPHGPEGFYLRLGFRPTGEELLGEVVGELTGPPAAP